MYDIYMDIETDNIRLEELIKRLKKEVNSISYNDLPIPPSPANASRLSIYLGKIICKKNIFVNGVVHYLTAHNKLCGKFMQLIHQIGFFYIFK